MEMKDEEMKFRQRDDVGVHIWVASLTVWNGINGA
jgi:hypothetical protein